jgi:menaquinone-9 beta-reductase
VAALLARAGVRALLLDKARFPREKVCGDGIAPKALYWLDRLGCVDEVLAQTRSYITQGDLFVGGEKTLTVGFPQDTPFPGFCILLERKKLDHILVQHAVSCGAVLRPGCQVKALRHERDGVVVEGVNDSGDGFELRSKVVVGADGANSIVSRTIGNRVLDGTAAASMRGYYQGVHTDGPRMQIHFEEEFFPGYGWLFVDDDGKANVGVGYVFDRHFPVRIKLRKTFEKFLKTSLKAPLRHARPVGEPRGGVACFYGLAHLTSNRVLLAGDAANAADPLNGSGIHAAIESGHFVAATLLDALAVNDFSAEFLHAYEDRWNRENGVDWRTGELLLSLAKNAHLRDVYLYLLRAIGVLARGDARFQAFCGGIYSGMIPASKAFCPRALFEATPLDPVLWLAALLSSRQHAIEDMVRQATSVAELGLRLSGRVARNPLAMVCWAAEVLTKTGGLAGCYARRELAEAVRDLSPATSAGWNGQVTGPATH